MRLKNTSDASISWASGEKDAMRDAFDSFGVALDSSSIAWGPGGHEIYV